MNSNIKPDIAALFEEGEAIDAALRRGVRRDLWRHVAEGLPIAEWIDGRVVWTPPAELEAWLRSTEEESDSS